MTKTHAMLRLLEHGPLTFAEAREITGWPRAAVCAILQHLVVSGRVHARHISRQRCLYEL